jgi:hypothetical protein
MGCKIPKGPAYAGPIRFWNLAATFLSNQSKKRTRTKRKRNPGNINALAKKIKSIAILDQCLPVFGFVYVV